jgi:hypothetical protein
MTRPLPIRFVCRLCDRGFSTSAWSRYAAHRTCPRCFKRRAGELLDTLHKMGLRPPPCDPAAQPPDW